MTEFSAESMRRCSDTFLQTSPFYQQLKEKTESSICAASKQGEYDIEYSEIMVEFLSQFDKSSEEEQQLVKRIVEYYESFLREKGFSILDLHFGGKIISWEKR
jgi:hypothetical protein